MSVISEPLLFAFALIDTGSVLFVLVYFVIALTDLECDYLNAQQCCSSLNRVGCNLKGGNGCGRNCTRDNVYVQWIVPKITAHTLLNIILLFYGHWELTLANLPMTIWLLYEYFTVPRGNMGVYDPTEIHNRGQLRKHQRDCMIYLGYYLIFFFVYLYCMIIALVRGDPIDRSDEIVEF